MSDTLIVDCETHGLNPELGEIAFAVGVGSPASERVTIYRLDVADDRTLLVEALRKATTLINHNIKFDLRQLLRTLHLPLDFFAGKRLIDTWILARHLLPGRDWKGGYGLKILTKDLPGLPTYENPKKWLRKNAEKSQRGNYSLLPTEILLPYLTADIVRTRALYQMCAPLLSGILAGTQGQIDVDLALIPIILNMELKGVAISAENLQAAETGMQAQLAEMRKLLPFDFLKRTEILKYFGDFLRRFQFETPGGAPRADHEALLFLQSRNIPWAEEVLRARQYHKLLTTYLATWRKYVRIGRLHGAFNIAGTRTGRLSSSNPNLQNIPKLLRRVIVPDPDTVLVCADYERMELWAAYYLSHDKTLGEALRQDVHYETAKGIFDTKSPTDMQRKAAKRVNFAIIYGARAKKLRAALSVETGNNWSLKDAETVRDRATRLYPGLAAWSATIGRFAQQRMAVTDPLGRRQYPDLYRPFALTNYLVQGFSAGIVKRAMLAAASRGLDIRLQVHDELVVSTTKEALPETVKILREVMRTVGDFTFPVEVSVCANNWADKEKYVDPVGA